LSCLCSISRAIQEVLALYRIAIATCQQIFENSRNKASLTRLSYYCSSLQTSMWIRASSHLIILSHSYVRTGAATQSRSSFARKIRHQTKPNETTFSESHLLQKPGLLAPIPKNSLQPTAPSSVLLDGKPLMRRRDCHEYVTEWQVRRASDLHQEAIPILFLTLGLFWFELGVTFSREWSVPIALLFALQEKKEPRSRAFFGPDESSSEIHEEGPEF